MQNRVDFVIEKAGKALSIEIKSGKAYYRHNALNKVLDLPDYDINEGYVFAMAISKQLTR